MKNELKQSYENLLPISEEIISRCNIVTSVGLIDNKVIDTFSIDELSNYYLNLIKFHYYHVHINEIVAIENKVKALQEQITSYIKDSKIPKIFRIFLAKDRKDILKELETKGVLDNLQSAIIQFNTQSLNIEEGYINDYKEHKDNYYKLLSNEYKECLCIDKNIIDIESSINTYKNKIINNDFASKYFYRSVHKVCTDIIKDEKRTRMFSTDLSSIKNRAKGISFKKLANIGYRTLNDIYAKSLYAYELKDLPTVTESNYLDFKKDIDDAVNAINKSVKITLNIDNMTRNKLCLLDLARYDMEKESIANRVARLNTELLDLEVKVDEYIKNDNTLARFIYSKIEEDKERYKTIKSIYADISNELNNIANLIRAVDTGCKIYIDTLEEFRKHPVDYISTLSKIAPEYFDTDTEYTSSIKDKEEIEEIKRIRLVKDDLKCILRPYQEFGTKYILHNHNVLLGDDMGLGKTIQALSVMCHLSSQGKKTFMVVCPVGLIANWCNEVSLKSTLKTYPFKGYDDFTVSQWQRKGGVAITNYESLKSAQYLIKDTIDFIVVDEAHNIKNPNAARSEATLNVCNKAEKKLFMTGTPLENNVKEMIGLIKYLEPDIGSKLNSERPNSEYFKETIKNVYYRRKKEDVLTELPDLVIQEDWCYMTAEDLDIYREAVMDKHLMNMRRVGWHENYQCSSKLQKLTAIINQGIEDGRKIIIFSYFLNTLDTIEDYLCEEFKTLTQFRIDGGVSSANRQAIIDEFTDKQANCVLLSQISTGGVGLNIQAASLVVMCEPQIKPSMEEQAISRSHRMGQVRNVIVHKLLCRNSIDERMLEILSRKKQDFINYADESVAANNDKIALNNASMNEIVEQEYNKWHKESN